MESQDVRRRTMQAVRSKDTAPEMIVRKLLHSEGYRYRLHRSDLPGCPDIVFGTRRKVIFVHGCFWHGHKCARGARVPKSNTSYWTSKVRRNRIRDAEVVEKLAADGWCVLVLWECEMDSRLKGRLKRFLEK
jgi:DNA mismatch endonuclease (patch repair protein)